MNPDIYDSLLSIAIVFLIIAVGTLMFVIDRLNKAVSQRDLFLRSLDFATQEMNAQAAVIRRLRNGPYAQATINLNQPTPEKEEHAQESVPIPTE